MYDKIILKMWNHHQFSRASNILFRKLMNAQCPMYSSRHSLTTQLVFHKVTFSEIGCIFWRGSPQETSQKSITLVLWLEQSIHVKRVDNWILLLCITLRLCILSAMNATQKKSGAHFVANYVYHRLCHIRGMINWPKVHQFRKLFACVLYIIGLSYLKKEKTFSWLTPVPGE